MDIEDIIFLLIVMNFHSMAYIYYLLRLVIFLVRNNPNHMGCCPSSIINIIIKLNYIYFA